jgi:hypothetical protein
MSRAKAAKFGETFLPLRPWRLGAINLLKVVLFNPRNAVQNLMCFPVAAVWLKATRRLR